MTDLLAQLAPHGGFTIHACEGMYGDHGGLAVYVICECGRGYSWEQKIPGAELVAWLSNHGPDIPPEEEERRVKAAGRPTVELVAGPAPEPPPHATVQKVAGVDALAWFEGEEGA